MREIVNEYAKEYVRLCCMVLDEAHSLAEYYGTNERIFMALDGANKLHRIYRHAVGLDFRV